MNSIMFDYSKYALSENGAKDMVRAFAVSHLFSDLVLTIPAGLLYQFIDTAQMPPFRQPDPFRSAFGMPGTNLGVHLHPV